MPPVVGQAIPPTAPPCTSAGPSAPTLEPSDVPGGMGQLQMRVQQFQDLLQRKREFL